jgi:hypothetical protein
VSLVEGGWGAARRRDLPVVRGFLGLSPEERRGALATVARAAGRGGAITLVAPACWCAVRPVEATTREWAGARGEIVRSIDRLLPLAPEDALVGIVDLFPDDEGAGAASGGAVVGVRRSLVAPWVEALERALPGWRVAEVVSPEMAALGAGLQGAQSATVEDGEGQVRVRLRRGRAVGVDDGGGAPMGGPRLRLTDEPGAGAISAHDLAVAGALAPLAAAGEFAPLLGRAAPPRKRWAACALAGVVAVAALAGAPALHRARLESATEGALARRQAISARVDEALRLRAEAERYARVLEAGVGPIESSWRSVLPALADAQGAIPEDGFAHRVEIDGRGVTLRAEAGSAGEALRRLENSASFAGAEFTAPVSKGSGAGEVFQLRARRDKDQGEMR